LRSEPTELNSGASAPAVGNRRARFRPRQQVGSAEAVGADLRRDAGRRSTRRWIIAWASGGRPVSFAVVAK
jgi:hypothetical protein